MINAYERVTISHPLANLKAIIEAINYSLYQLETDLEPQQRPEDFTWTNGLTEIVDTLTTIYQETLAGQPTINVRRDEV